MEATVLFELPGRVPVYCMSCSGKGRCVCGVSGPVEQVQQGVQGGQVHDRGRGQEGHQGHGAGGGRDRSQTEEVGRLQLSSVFVILSAQLGNLLVRKSNF